MNKLPDLPRMEIRLCADYPFGASHDETGCDYFDTILEMEEYLRTFANERLISVNCVGYRAVSYCVCAEGTHMAASSNTAMNNAAKAALLSNADHVLLFHNHPSGSTEPSQGDMDMVCYLENLLSLVDIHIDDLIIVGPCGKLQGCKALYPEYFEASYDRIEKILPDRKVKEDKIEDHFPYLKETMGQKKE